MKKSKQLQKQVRLLIEASFKDGKMLESQIVKSIKVLKSLSRNEAIEGLSEYLKGLKRKEREHTMYIETIIPLSLLQLKKARRIVEKKSLPAGRQVRITKVITKVNPEILGGFKLRVGDEIWDESTLAKINQLKEAIRG